MAIETPYVAIGGKLWTSSDNSKHRVYFPAELLEEIVGLSYTTYKTGNISGASLHGSKISNGKAEQLRTTLRMGKCWYDCEAQTLMTQGLGATIGTQVVAGIKARL